MFKKFRIGKMVAVCTLILALVTPMVGFADDTVEANEPATKPRVLNRNVERSIVKPDREKVERFLVVVEKYSPETLSDWEALAEERKGILEDILEVREDIRELRGEKVEDRKEIRRENVERIRDNFREEAAGFRAELAEKVRNGEMTREEAKAQLTEYAEGRKEMAEAKRDEYKGKVEEWKAEKKAKLEEWKEEHQDEIDRFKAKREEIMALREELKAAVEADDAEAVKAALNELYPEMQQVNNFLANRLEWLQEKYDQISTMEDIVISE